jgi:hypothetical protein
MSTQEQRAARLREQREQIREQDARYEAIVAERAARLAAGNTSRRQRRTSRRPGTPAISRRSRKPMRPINRRPPSSIPGLIGALGSTRAS